MNKRFIQAWAAAATLAAYGGVSHAAVTAEEAHKLGVTLTAVGAEKAGNRDGTIPEYSGGLSTPPAGFVAGSGVRVLDRDGAELPMKSGGWQHF